MDLGRIGAWWSGSWRAGDGVDVAAEMEDLGYTALWSSGGFEAGLAAHFAKLVAATERLVVASGIVSIWHTTPKALADAAAEIERAHPGRFLVGLGASHAPLVADYSQPYGRMVEFLDRLDRADPAITEDRRILAALGPRMLALAGERSAGAHPYFVSATHTARAREILGAGPLLAPEVTVVVERDPNTARELARTFMALYLGLPNYTNNLKTVGFSDNDLAGGGSDRLVDAVVCWGDPEQIAAKVATHFEAGADHVCIQVVNTSRELFPIADYRALAPALLG